MNENAQSAALLSVTQSVAVFTAVMPKMSDVRKAVGNEELANDVRMGEMTSAAIVIGIGVLATSFTKSPVPAAVAVIATLAFVLMYESILATTPKEIR